MPPNQLLKAAYQALRKGDRLAARRLAQEAAHLAPEKEEAWLLLAAISNPRASVAYLDQALKINPHSERARAGMHWAARRLRSLPRPAPVVVRPRLMVRPARPTDQTRTRKLASPWALLSILALLMLTAWFGTPQLSQAFSPGYNQAQDLIRGDRATLTFTPTHTPTHTPTFTQTPTPTHTPTPTNTPTETPTETPTFTPEPTATPWPTQTPRPVNPSPSELGEGERWIDVDLTNQRVHAYVGSTIVRSFIVSTGTWQTPTVTGQYKIYVKYRYADMSGPGYYLPDVPYVMYFYQGYGFHGTYWHSNFGTPMSHGCVNLETSDAGWLFDFASIGTLVNIHY